MSVSVVVPFDWGNTQDSPNTDIASALANLLESGIRLASAEGHYRILQKYRPPSHTMRATIKVRLKSDITVEWEEKSYLIQKFKNRHVRDRLPVVVIAQAVAKRYNVPLGELISSGFLSPRVIELVVSQKPGDFEGDKMPVEIRLEAEMMTGSDLAAFEKDVARVREMPDHPGRILTQEESGERLKSLIKKAKAALSPNLN